MSKSFNDGDFVEINNTCSDLDGLIVSVVGMSYDCRPAAGSVYVVMQKNGIKFESGWTTLCISESCLSHVKLPVVKKEITDDKILGITACILTELSNSDMDRIRNTDSGYLIHLNSTLGRDIRNNYGLWDYPYKPNIDIATGIDYSPKHPEAVSMTIIKNIWNILQKGHI